MFCSCFFGGEAVVKVLSLVLHLLENTNLAFLSLMWPPNVSAGKDKVTSGQFVASVCE